MKRKLKAVCAGLLALAIGLTASGCGMRKSDGKKTVGIAMPAKFLERWNRDGEYLKRRFEDEGYNVELRFSDNNINQQVNDIQVLIADDVDLLIISAIDGGAMFRTLEDAAIKDIPVICYDRMIPNSEAVKCYVSFDNYTVGQLQAGFIIDSLGIDKEDNDDGVFNIELVMGDTADTNASVFYRGSIDTLQPYLDSGKIKIPSGKVTFEQTATPGWETDKALKNMQNILASHYSGGTTLDAVLCTSDCLSIGVIQAIQTDYNGHNDPVITGQDGDIAALRALVDNTLDMTVYKNVQHEADATVIVARTILEGRTPDDSITSEFPAKCVFDNETYNNGKEPIASFLLTPEVIEADGLEKLVGTGLYMWDDDHRYLRSTS